MANMDGFVQIKDTTDSPYLQAKTDDIGNMDGRPTAMAAIPLDYSTGNHGVDINMEAPVSDEDLIRAGGLGARDEVDSMIPTAVDGTDYEESLMDAMDYEDKADAKLLTGVRPGLGASHEQIDIPGGIMVPSKDYELK